MENKEYVNPFVDVRNRVEVFKARLRETNKIDEELRGSRFRREIEELPENKPK